MIFHILFASLLYSVLPVIAQNNGDGKLLTVMSYNIHHANPPSRPGMIDINAIASVINQHKPDIAALQEVDVNTVRSGINEATVLARKTGMYLYFGKAIDYDSGHYGVAILSKYPLSETATYPLPTAAGTNGEPRVLATATIMAGSKKITVACTHLDAQREDTNRLIQVKAINDFLAKQDNPVILAGDFNAPPGSRIINILDKKFTRTCPGNCSRYTIPVIKPAKTIDFITFSPTAFTTQSHKVIDEQYASDHLPVIATLKIN